MILLGFAGARLLSVLGDWRAYAADPAKILAVSQGGLTVTGGILGGIHGRAPLRPAQVA